MSRWIATKEDHASKIITTVSEYFLTQKVKPVAKDDVHYQQYVVAVSLLSTTSNDHTHIYIFLVERRYCDVLAQHHGVMVAAMKVRQEVFDQFCCFCGLRFCHRHAIHTYILGQAECQCQSRRQPRSCHWSPRLGLQQINQKLESYPIHCLAYYFVFHESCKSDAWVWVSFNRK